LQAFLQSANEVMDALTQPEDPPANTQQIIAAARKQSEQLRSDSPSSAQNCVRRGVQRVVIHPDRIEVEVNKSELHAALAGSSGMASRQGSSNVVLLVLEARIKRCDGEMRLVVPPDLPGQARPYPTPSLLKVVARAHQWCEWIISGKVWGRRSIAEKTGLDERYASQILECAFLAPDIVDAILDGRQPTNLTWKRLTRHVPMNWVEQRRRLGFAAI
jgi:site-specific DNA recombinase